MQTLRWVLIANVSALIVVYVLGARTALSEEPVAAQARAGEAVRFMAVHVFIDSHEAPLAAYQFDLIGRGSDVKIVGLEGGEHPAFADAPYYDSKAMMGDRVIAAAFSTKSAGELPAGRVRVATVHLQVEGSADPQFEVKLTTAANTDGEKIAADIRIQKGIEQ